MKTECKWDEQLEMTPWELKAWDKFAAAAILKITLPMEDGLPCDINQAANWANEMIVARRRLTKVIPLEA